MKFCLLDPESSGFRTACRRVLPVVVLLLAALLPRTASAQVSVTINPDGYTGNICFGAAGCVQGGTAKTLSLTNGLAITLPSTEGETTAGTGLGSAVVGNGSVTLPTQYFVRDLQAEAQTGVITFKALTVGPIAYQSSGISVPVGLSGSFGFSQNIKLVRGRRYYLVTLHDTARSLLPLKPLTADVKVTADGALSIVTNSESSKWFSVDGLTISVKDTATLDLYYDRSNTPLAVRLLNIVVIPTTTSPVRLLKGRRYRLIEGNTGHIDPIVGAHFSRDHDLVVSDQGVVSIDPNADASQSLDIDGAGGAWKVVIKPTARATVTYQSNGSPVPVQLYGLHAFTGAPIPGYGNGSAGPSVQVIRSRRYRLLSWNGSSDPVTGVYFSDKTDLQVDQSGTVSLVAGTTAATQFRSGPGSGEFSPIVARVVLTPPAGHNKAICLTPGSGAFYGCSAIGALFDQPLIIKRRYYVSPIYSYLTVNAVDSCAPSPLVNGTVSYSVTCTQPVIAQAATTCAPLPAGDGCGAQKLALMTLTPLGAGTQRACVTGLCTDGTQPVTFKVVTGMSYEVEGTGVQIPVAFDGTCSSSSMTIGNEQFQISCGPHYAAVYEWRPNRAYSVGERVLHLGRLFTAKGNHVSGVGSPGSDPALWGATEVEVSCAGKADGTPCSNRRVLTSSGSGGLYVGGCTAQACTPPQIPPSVEDIVRGGMESSESGRQYHVVTVGNVIETHFSELGYDFQYDVLFSGPELLDEAVSLSFYDHTERRQYLFFADSRNPELGFKNQALFESYFGGMSLSARKHLLGTIYRAPRDLAFHKAYSRIANPYHSPRNCTEVCGFSFGDKLSIFIAEFAGCGLLVEGAASLGGPYAGGAVGTGCAIGAFLGPEIVESSCKEDCERCYSDQARCCEGQGTTEDKCIPVNCSRFLHDGCEDSEPVIKRPR